MRRECRECFPRHRGLAILTCITTRAWRTCRDACRDRYIAVSFEVGGGENLAGIPGTCATRNFTYLVRGPWEHFPNCWPFVRESWLFSRRAIDAKLSWFLFVSFIKSWTTDLRHNNAHVTSHAAFISGCIQLFYIYNCKYSKVRWQLKPSLVDDNVYHT